MLHLKKVNPKFSQKMEKELRGYELCPLDNPCYASNSHRLFWSCFYGRSPLSILFHTAWVGQLILVTGDD